MIHVSSCRCLSPIYWSQVLSRELRCSWSSAGRRCSNYIWAINNLIVYQSTPYIGDLTVSSILLLVERSAVQRVVARILIVIYTFAEYYSGPHSAIKYLNLSIFLVISNNDGYQDFIQRNMFHSYWYHGMKKTVRITGPLWRKSTGKRWIVLTKVHTVTRCLGVFLLLFA